MRFCPLVMPSFARNLRSSQVNIGDRYFEVFLPITAPESTKSWGTVQLGISSLPLEKLLSETQFHLIVLGLLCLSLGLIGAASLAARITTPIQELGQRIPPGQPKGIYRCESMSNPEMRLRRSLRILII